MFSITSSVPIVLLSGPPTRYRIKVVMNAAGRSGKNASQI